MISREFEVIDRLNILKFAKRRMRLIYVVTVGTSLLQILSDICGWDFHLMSLAMALSLFILFNCLYFFIFLPRYRRLTSVKLQQDGIGYASREVIPWSQMCDVTYVWENNLPYLSLMKKSDVFGKFHVPLYLKHLDAFRDNLRDAVPKGHELEKFLPELQKLDLDKIPTQTRWWKI